MLQLWRFQQSQAILGLVLWASLLTLTAYPILAGPIFGFLGSFGIAADTRGAVALALGIIFVSIAAALFLFGLVYDKVFRLWREQTDVLVDRNPYTRERLTAKEILTWRHMFLPALQASSARNPDRPNNPDLVSHIAFMEDWIARSLDDPRTRRAVEETQEWIEPKP